MRQPTTFTLESDVRQALTQVAAREGVTRSWLANRLLRQQLGAGAVSIALGLPGASANNDRPRMPDVA